MNKRRTRGRPPVGSTAREDLLTAARRQFLHEGYTHATLRSIASEAGVDVALIGYHFGSKKGLFGEAMELTANPTLAIAQALDAPLALVPERLLRALLTVWDDPRRRAPLLRLMELVTHDEEAAQLFREMAERDLFGQIANRLGDRPRQAAAAAAVLTGLIQLRYVLRVEPLASMAAEDVTALMLPTMRAAMTSARTTRSPPSP